MWECKQCFYKNNNSTERCHGKNCKAEREFQALEIPVAIQNEGKDQEETVYDWCSVCGKDQYFTKTGRVNFRMRYKCHGCHKPFIKIGKNKVKPSEVFQQ